MNVFHKIYWEVKTRCLNLEDLTDVWFKSQGDLSKPAGLRPYNPLTRIAFSELVRRLERIKKK
tara:strand:- start:1081 stop:1269 length:189 start_codon:yes stop_codon:yes gene_type:complete